MSALSTNNYKILNFHESLELVRKYFIRFSSFFEHLSLFGKLDRLSNPPIQSTSTHLWHHSKSLTILTKDEWSCYPTKWTHEKSWQPRMKERKKLTHPSRELGSSRFCYITCLLSFLHIHLGREQREISWELLVSQDNMNSILLPFAKSGAFKLVFMKFGQKIRSHQSTMH